MSTVRIAEHPVDPQFTERWSPRSYTGEALPREQLMSLLEAARWAPSASNQQPWRFVWALAGTPAFDAIHAGLMAGNQGWAAQASALVVVLSVRSQVPAGQTEPKANPWASFDAGAAWMSLALQARALGWDTHAMGGFERSVLDAALQVPASMAIEAVVAIGRRGDPAALPEALRAREQPNARLPLAALAAEGRCDFGA